MARTRDVVIGVVIGGAFLVFFLFMILFIYLGSSDRDFSFSGLGDKVAIVNLFGIIESSGNVVRQLDRWADDDKVRAIVIHINSPGGGVAASQEIYDKILKVRSETDKPIVAAMSSVCASGGYYVACAADQIVANPGTLTGSIGVILQWPVLDSMLNKVGISYETIKSGERKDMGSPFRQPTDADRDAFQAVIDDVYQQFVAAVAEQRNMNWDDALRIADGSIYSGRQAFELNLIDTLGTFEDAVSLAGELGGLGSDPDTVREYPRRRTTIFDLIDGVLNFNLSKLIDGGQLVTYPTLQYIMN
jgi:protease-4